MNLDKINIDLDELIDDSSSNDYSSKDCNNEDSSNTTNKVIHEIETVSDELVEKYKNESSNVHEKYFKIIKLLDEKVNKLNSKLNKLYADEDHNPSTVILLDKISKRLDRKSNKNDVKILDDKVNTLELSMNELNEKNKKSNQPIVNNVDMTKIEEFITNEITKRFSELQSIIDARLDLINEKVTNVQKSLFSQMIN